MNKLAMIICVLSSLNGTINKPGSGSCNLENWHHHCTLAPSMHDFSRLWRKNYEIKCLHSALVMLSVWWRQCCLLSWHPFLYGPSFSSPMHRCPLTFRHTSLTVSPREMDVASPSPPFCHCLHAREGR